MKILQIMFGIILLLPGICSIGFMTLFLPDIASSDAAPISALWLFSFGISAFGVMLIRNARRK